jgi:hypothetical protein
MKKVPALFLGGIVLFWAGCPVPEQSVLPGGSVLEVAERIVSIGVGESATVHVTALGTDGGPDGFSVSCSNSCIDATASADGTATVVGVELGEATLRVTSTSGLSRDVTVRVRDPKALMTGGLAITYTDQFEWRWDDAGSGQSTDGVFWHPVLPGYYALGSVGFRGQANPNNQFAALMVKEVGGSSALAAPVDYELIRSFDFSYPGSFWLPIAPPGYVALGAVVAASTADKPGLDEVRGVRADLVANARAIGGTDTIWWYGSSFGCCEIVTPDVPNFPGKAYLKAGTFIAVNSSTTPAPVSNPALYVLNVKLPLAADINDSTFAPVLDSYGSPPDSTDAYLSKVIEVPFPLVLDSAYDLHWKVTNSPIYRIRREEYYKLQCFFNNRFSSTELPWTVTDTVGISQTESETYSLTVGLKISSTSGCSLVGGDVTVELSIEFGYETTSSLTVFRERSVSRQVIIAPHTSGCLWQKATRFTLMRNGLGGWEDVAGSAMEITIESFVKGEYPH